MLRLKVNYIRMKFHTRTILYREAVKLSYIGYLISKSEKNFTKIELNKENMKNSFIHDDYLRFV